MLCCSLVHKHSILYRNFNKHLNLVKAKNRVIMIKYKNIRIFKLYKRRGHNEVRIFETCKIYEIIGS